MPAVVGRVGDRWRPSPRAGARGPGHRRRPPRSAASSRRRRRPPRRTGSQAVRSRPAAGQRDWPSSRLRALNISHLNLFFYYF